VLNTAVIRKNWYGASFVPLKRQPLEFLGELSMLDWSKMSV
jgi:hypothetical protein